MASKHLCGLPAALQSRLLSPPTDRLSRALPEALAAVVDDDDFLGLVVDVHVQDGSVRVDHVCAHVGVLLREEPFLLQVDVAAAVDENQTGDRL